MASLATELGHGFCRCMGFMGLTWIYLGCGLGGEGGGPSILEAQVPVFRGKGKPAAELCPRGLKRNSLIAPFLSLRIEGPITWSHPSPKFFEV